MLYKQTKEKHWQDPKEYPKKTMENSQVILPQIKDMKPLCFKNQV